jgi:hypothetical protein
MMKGRAIGAPFVVTREYSHVIDQKTILILGVVCGSLSQVLRGSLDQPGPFIVGSGASGGRH